jgi:hypothetical protein
MERLRKLFEGKAVVSIAKNDKAMIDPATPDGRMGANQVFCLFGRGHSCPRASPKVLIESPDFLNNISPEKDGYARRSAPEVGKTQFPVRPVKPQEPVWIAWVAKHSSQPIPIRVCRQPVGNALQQLLRIPAIVVRKRHKLFPDMVESRIPGSRQSRF